MKLSGFTLLELILTMIVSTIVIALMYLAVVDVEKLWGNFHTEQVKLADVLIFQRTFQDDIDRADIVQVHGENQFRLVSEKDTLIYSFGKNITRRYRDLIDSFCIECTNTLPYYVGALKSLGTVYGIEIQLEHPVRLEKVKFYKYYSSQSLCSQINQLK